MKKLKFIFLGLVTLTVFSGCVHSGRYQLVPVQNKDSYQVFKIDKTTGEVWALGGKNWVKVGDEK